MSEAIRAAKAELRKAMTIRRDAQPDDMRTDAASRLALLADSPEFQGFLPETGGIISGYWPIRSELNPLPLMLALAEQGYRLAFPRIADGRLGFHHGLPDALIPGTFGTREPPAHWPEVIPALILTPLLAYDDQGGRLGYGKGYYDRAFMAHPEARRVGVAHLCQRVETVPREAHDVGLERVFAV